ncbi:interferon-induced protein 44-like [Chanos chanos]|uniref:Interferon-induced protein 44-like n=1 Tax=Chanos chanos TaxID=29144 RepID=A0A6J2WD45_CHACN|nr:interferon-induced protein 44-like [Chanos chanos]
MGSDLSERLKILNLFDDVTAHGGQKIVLKCGVNKDGATAKWLKNNKQVSESVNVTITQNGKEFILTIKQAQRSDHGTYTCEVTLSNEKVKCTADITVQEFEKAWRTSDWDLNSRNKMMKELRLFKPEVDPIRILLHGPVGARKSSFVNSIDTVFRGHITSRALADAGTGKSFTKTYKSYRFRITGHPGFLPFVVNDIMGLEKKVSAGAHNDDIISALRGHIKDNQEFNPGSPLSEGDPGYNSSPSLKDKVHCLVSVLPADKISLIDDAVIKKMRKIREEASDMGIPQVVVMTMVDRACPVVAKDLRKIYTSLKIKEKMEECHIRLGVPMNCIFPLKNYHEEGSTVLELDCLILATLTQIIHLANDYLSTIFENVERVNFKPTAEMAKLVANIKPTVKMVTQMASIRPTAEMEKPVCLTDNDLL